jgi:hypothetical protein
MPCILRAGGSGPSGFSCCQQALHSTQQGRLSIIIIIMLKPEHGSATWVIAELSNTLLLHSLTGSIQTARRRRCYPAVMML